MDYLLRDVQRGGGAMRAKPHLAQWNQWISGFFFWPQHVLSPPWKKRKQAPPSHILNTPLGAFSFFLKQKYINSTWDTQLWLKTLFSLLMSTLLTKNCWTRLRTFLLFDRFYRYKIWGKSVKEFMHYDRKQTNNNKNSTTL